MGAGARGGQVGAGTGGGQVSEGAEGNQVDIGARIVQWWGARAEDCCKIYYALLKHCIRLSTLKFTKQRNFFFFSQG